MFWNRPLYKSWRPKFNYCVGLIVNVETWHFRISSFNFYCQTGFPNYCRIDYDITASVRLLLTILIFLKRVHSTMTSRSNWEGKLHKLWQFKTPFEGGGFRKCDVTISDNSIYPVIIFVIVILCDRLYFL